MQIPAGASSATVTLTPKEDTAAEGTETISIALPSTAAYNVGPGTNVVLTLLDNEATPPPISLQMTSPMSGLFELSLTGAATRLYAIETSTDLLI